MGSGSGSMSSLFVENGFSLRLNDHRRHYGKSLQKRFGSEALIKGVYRINPRLKEFSTVYEDMLGEFDTLVALNVFENSSIDKIDIAAYKQLLRKGGHLMLVTPASAALYRELGEGFDHWQRYNWIAIRKLLTNDFGIMKMQFFKVMGHVGWYLSKLFLRNEILQAKTSSLYQQNVPLFLGVDEVVFHRSGLLILTIAKKK